MGVPSAGDCNTIDCVGVYVYDSRDNLSPGYRYSGQRLNYDVAFHCNPSLTCQDLEFSVRSCTNAVARRKRTIVFCFYYVFIFL